MKKLSLAYKIVAVDTDSLRMFSCNYGPDEIKSFINGKSDNKEICEYSLNCLTEPNLSQNPFLFVFINMERAFSVKPYFRWDYTHQKISILKGLAFDLTNKIPNSIHIPLTFPGRDDTYFCKGFIPLEILN